MTDASREDIAGSTRQDSVSDQDHRTSSLEEREAAAEIEPQTGHHPDNDGETVEE